MQQKNHNENRLFVFLIKKEMLKEIPEIKIVKYLGKLGCSYQNRRELRLSKKRKYV